MAKWEYDGEFCYYEDIVMMSIPDIHIRAENVDDIAKQKGIDAKEIIFLSRHKAVSGIPTLTVHPIGNYHDAEFGGRSKTLVKASPATMSEILRNILSSDTGEFKASFEVTHHGPFVSIPAVFVEIGSDAPQWKNEDASKVISDALLKLHDNGYENAIGIGGGHYAPRFTEVAEKYKINIGHMIPEYAFRDADDDDLIRMIKDAAKNSFTNKAYIHKRSMRSEVVKRVINAIASCGMEAISSNDLDIIEN
jgi:D-aminoacyl-tRNA deacylase